MLPSGNLRHLLESQVTYKQINKKFRLYLEIQLVHSVLPTISILITNLIQLVHINSSDWMMLLLIAIYCNSGKFEPMCNLVGTTV